MRQILILHHMVTIAGLDGSALDRSCRPFLVYEFSFSTLTHLAVIIFGTYAVSYTLKFVSFFVRKMENYAPVFKSIKQLLIMKI